MSSFLSVSDIILLLFSEIHVNHVIASITWIVIRYSVEELRSRYGAKEQCVGLFLTFSFGKFMHHVKIRLQNK